MAGITSNLSDSITATLVNTDLWKKFNELGTEMIITKSGRRMFPFLELSFVGLDPNEMYMLLVDMIPVNGYKYKYSERLQQWVESCNPLGSGAVGIYKHPDGPFRGSALLKDPIKLNKVKLTNTFDHIKFNQILLESMCRFAPRVTVIRLRDFANHETSKAAVFTFKETGFMAVTAYMNKQITKLKIDNNPFATGFREERFSHFQDKFAHCRDKVKQADSPNFNQYCDFQEDISPEVSQDEEVSPDVQGEETSSDNDNIDTGSDVLMYSVSTGEDSGDNIQVLHVNPSSIVVTDVPPSPSTSQPETPTPSSPTIHYNINLANGCSATVNGDLVTRSDSLEPKRDALATTNGCLVTVDRSVNTKSDFVETTSSSLVTKNDCLATVDSGLDTSTNDSAGKLWTTLNMGNGCLATESSSLETTYSILSMESKDSAATTNGEKSESQNSLVSKGIPEGFIALEFAEHLLQEGQNTIKVNKEPTDSSICLVTNVRSIAKPEAGKTEDVEDVARENRRQEQRSIDIPVHGPAGDNQNQNESIDRPVRVNYFDKSKGNNSEGSLDHLRKDTQISKLLEFVNSHPMDVFKNVFLESPVDDSEDFFVGEKRPSVVDHTNTASKKIKSNVPGQSNSTMKKQSNVISVGKSVMCTVADNANVAFKENSLHITSNNISKSRDCEPLVSKGTEDNGLLTLECNETFDYEKDLSDNADSSLEQKETCHSEGSHDNTSGYTNDKGLSQQNVDTQPRCISKESLHVKTVVKQKPVQLTDNDIQNAIKSVECEKTIESKNQSGAHQSNPKVTNYFLPITLGQNNNYPSNLRVHERQQTSSTPATSIPCSIPVSSDVEACESIDGGQFPVILETYSLNPLLQQQQLQQQQQRQWDQLGQQQQQPSGQHLQHPLLQEQCLTQQQQGQQPQQQQQRLQDLRVLQLQQRQKQIQKQYLTQQQHGQQQQQQRQKPTSQLQQRLLQQNNQQQRYRRPLLYRQQIQQQQQQQQQQVFTTQQLPLQQQAPQQQEKQSLQQQQRQQLIQKQQLIEQQHKQSLQQQKQLIQTQQELQQQQKQSLQQQQQQQLIQKQQLIEQQHKQSLLQQKQLIQTHQELQQQQKQSIQQQQQQLVQNQQELQHQQQQQQQHQQYLNNLSIKRYPPVTTNSNDKGIQDKNKSRKRHLIPRPTYSTALYDRNLATFLDEHRKTGLMSQVDKNENSKQEYLFYPYAEGVFNSNDYAEQCRNCYLPPTDVKLEALYTFGSDFSRSRAPDPRLPEIYCPTRTTFTCYSYHVISSELPIIPQYVYTGNTMR